MPTFVRRPDHPQADEFGMVDKTLVTHDGVDPRYYVISDTMEPTRHMATGRYHTSKANFRADTKASGCVELGNDSSLLRPRKPVPLSREKRYNDIKRAIDQLRG